MKTIRRFLPLAAPFWWRNNPWFNWLLLAAVVGFSLAIVRVGVLITDWNKTFYDALAAFDGRAMPVLVTEFLVYIALVTGFIACGNWLRKVLLFRWREHLTRQFQQNWLGGHKHYRLQLTGEPDNPDQRIAEDVAMLSEKSIDLFKYFIMNAAKLGAFVEILWQLSGVQTFTLFGQSITVKGYLVWIALAYSAACTLLTHLIGRKLQPLKCGTPAPRGRLPRHAAARARVGRANRLLPWRNRRRRPSEQPFCRRQKQLARPDTARVLSGKFLRRLPAPFHVYPHHRHPADVSRPQHELWRHDESPQRVFQCAGRLRPVYGLLQMHHRMGGRGRTFGRFSGCFGRGGQSRKAA